MRCWRAIRRAPRIMALAGWALVVGSGCGGDAGPANLSDAAVEPDLPAADAGRDPDASAPPDLPEPDLGPPLPVDPELADYVALVAQAEAKLDVDPPRMLAVMRQLYYGAPWSATSSNSLWKLVIPCSPKLTDPRGELGDELFGALTARAELGGVDVGHVFAGLEAMVCPSAKVFVVDMNNEDFATWGGDLGAAVAARAACLALGAEATTTPNCGGKPGGQPLDFYVGVHALAVDIEGDLDPYVMRAQLMGSSCAESRMLPLVLKRPLSELFGDYYLRTDSALGLARRQRDRCIIELLGGELDGGQLANRDALVEQITSQVASFAETYYLTIRTGTLDAAEKTAMATDALEVVGDFIDGLQP